MSGPGRPAAPTGRPGTGTGPGRYDVVVLTGGRAARLGGVAKPGLLVGGVPIAARVLAAVPDAARRIVVGEPVAGVAVDVVTREEPAGGGPVAGLAAGLAEVTAPVVAVLGGDLPFVTAGVVRDLRSALGPGVSAAMLVDGSGRDQYLCAVWSVPALRAALAAVRAERVDGLAGMPLRVVVAAAGGSVVRRRAGQHPPAWFDCDTEQDLAIARNWAGG